MVSVAIIQPAIEAVMHKIGAMLQCRCTKYATPLGWWSLVISPTSDLAVSLVSFTHELR